MARRPHMTSADYLTIAVSPALIMTLLGSLVFFLVDVFYAGYHAGPAHYVFALFIFAAVLIGRISIEEGAERASLFALPLALATWFVLGLSLVNLAIIALVWWWAHKLTWDCTVIDDKEDASGEGLLQAAGLTGRPTGEGDRTTASDGAALECVDTPLATDQPPEDDGDKTARWWERFQQRRSRRQVPGLWVLYLSLGALPLFGFLQRTIPLSATDRRDFSFWLLVVYVASALGLLLSTSFLGLRRYLRQRRLQMPTPMTATWVVTGTVLILAVMILAALLPRPAAEVAISRVPFRLALRDDQSASRYAPVRSDPAPDKQQVARDRTAGDQPETDKGQQQRPGDRRSTGREQNGTTHAAQRTRQEPRKDKNEKDQPQDTAARKESSDSHSGGAAPQDAKMTQDETSRSEGAQDGAGQENAKQHAAKQDNAKQNGAKQNNAKQDDAQRDGAKQDNAQRDGAARNARGGQSEGGDRGGETERSDRDDRRRADEGTSGGGRSSQRGSRSANRQAAAEKPPGESRSEDGQPRGDRRDGSNAAARSPASSPPATQSPSAWSLQMAAGTSILGALLQLVFYALLIIAVGYLLWHNREKIGPALRQLIAELRELWARLFGGRATEAELEPSAEPPARQRRFADYRDPFATGAASRMRPEAVVALTLAAFEAWAREHGHPRRGDQTPRELVHRAVPADSPLADTAGLLVELHSRIAYGTGRVPAEQVGQLRQLWQQMRAHPPWKPTESAPLARAPADARISSP